MTINAFTLYAMIALTAICTLAGQLVLKGAVNNPALKAYLAEGPAQFLLHAAISPMVWLALFFQVAGYVTWFFVLTREKLAVAFAINSAIVYMLTGFAAWFFYGERLSLQQWAGLSLLTFGVLLMAYEP